MSSISSVMSSSMSSQFTKIDKNADGKVSKDEFVTGRPKGVSEAQATELFSKIDSAGSGAVTEAELKSSLEAYRPSGSASDVSGTNLSDESMATILDLLQQMEASSTALSSTGIDSQTGEDRLASLFTSMDANTDGIVTEDEFMAAKPEGMSDEEASELFAKLDLSGDGSFTLSEMEGSIKRIMMAMMQKMEASSTALSSTGIDSQTGEDRLASLFTSMDANTDGIVTEDEFMAAKPEGMSDEEASELFAKLDLSGDGSFTLSEMEGSIKRIMMAMMQSQESADTRSSPTDETYDALDTNKDGVVSEAERQASLEKTAQENESKSTDVLLAEISKAIGFYSAGTRSSSSTSLSA